LGASDKFLIFPGADWAVYGRCTHYSRVSYEAQVEQKTRHKFLTPDLYQLAVGHANHLTTVHSNW